MQFAAGVFDNGQQHLRHLARPQYFTACATAHKLSCWQALEELCKQVIHIELQDLCYMGQLLNLFVSLSLEHRKLPMLMPRSQSQSPKRLDQFNIGGIPRGVLCVQAGPTN